MPLTNAIHESLPYIDTEPTPTERSAALALIAAEAGTPPTEHPSLPPLAPEKLSPLVQAEHERIASQRPLAAITTAHYEQQDAPATAELPAWRSALALAHTSHTHLAARVTNLELLEQYGKPAWLAGNRQLEDILRGLERELESRKAEIDGVVIERKNAQDAVAGEMRGLEEGWRRGVGKVLETEVAAEGLRREILEKRREGAL